MGASAWSAQYALNDSRASSLKMMEWVRVLHKLRLGQKVRVLHEIETLVVTL